MKIAFVIYDGFTLLDFAGIYDPVTRLKTMSFVHDLDYHVCAQNEQIHSFEGIGLLPDSIGGNLSVYDYVILPGGNGIEKMMNDRKFLDWITVDTHSTTLVAVCGGSLLLGAAGMLRDRKATTHPGLRDVLKHFAREVSEDRIVDDNGIITGGGVTSAIDLGLFLCEKISGGDIRQKIAMQMDYPHYKRT
jgi:cyclohexyl-isocyanide hydratase